MKMRKMGCCILVGLTVTTLTVVGVPAEEKLITGHGLAAEVMDVRSLNTVAQGTAGPGRTMAVAVSHDRRYALVTEDSGGRLPNTPSLVVLDLTKPALPIVARLAPGLAVRDIRMIPGGGTAMVLAPGMTSSTLVFVNMNASPPQVSNTISIKTSFSVDVTPDGLTVFAADWLANTIDIIDLTKSPPATIGSIPAPANLGRIRISQDGLRLVATYNPKPSLTGVRIWDLTVPRQPQQLTDVMIQAEVGPVEPAVDPGNRFVAMATVPFFSQSALILVDTHANPPAQLSRLPLPNYLVTSLTIARDGTRAFVGTDKQGLTPPSIREVDLTNPAAPFLTNRVVQRFNTFGDLLAYGELHTYGSPRIGKVHPVYLSTPADAGQAYLLAASFATTPGFKVGNRTVPLNPDGLFLASLSLAGIFQNFTGLLDAQGQAVAGIRIPAVNALRGTSFFVAGVVLDPSRPNGIGTISNAELFRIQ